MAYDKRGLFALVRVLLCHVRDLIAGDLGVDDLGINVHLRDNAVWVSYPIAVIVGTKEA